MASTCWWQPEKYTSTSALMTSRNGLEVCLFMFVCFCVFMFLYGMEMYVCVFV